MVYSNYDPEHVRYLLEYVKYYARALEDFDRLPENEPKADEVRARFATSALGQLSEADLVCPTVRAFRVHEASCEANPRDDWVCKMDDQKLAERVRDAARRNLCLTETHADLAELLYTPVPVEIWPGGYPGE